jgi:hypothetical protein
MYPGAAAKVDDIDAAVYYKVEADVKAIAVSPTRKVDARSQMQ